VAFGELFVIYNILGYADLSLGIVAGMIALAVLASHRRRNVRRVVAVSVVALALLNVGVGVAVMESGFHNGERDPSQFRYLTAPASWYLRYGLQTSAELANQPHTVSDVLTCGFVEMSSVQAGAARSTGCTFFNRNQLLWLLGIDDGPTVNSSVRASLFIINLNEQRFAVQGWIYYDSWGRMQKRLDSTPWANVVYASGAIEVITPST